jgi:hypothetical protein
MQDNLLIFIVFLAGVLVGIYLENRNNKIL